MSSRMNCSICSNPTPSLRYQIPACNVCANFFRKRVLNETISTMCKSAGILEHMDCYKRLRCHSCRFQVCLAMGMSKEAVLTNAENRRVAAAIKTEGNHIKNEDNKQVIVLNPLASEVVVDRVLANLIRIEHAFSRLRVSTYNPLPGSITSLDVALAGTSKLSTNYGVEHFPPGTPEGYTDCNGSILENIYRRIRIGLERKNFELNRKTWYFFNIICSFEYFKAFDIFAQLSSRTRRALAGKLAHLCSNFTNLMYSVSQGRNYLIFPDGRALFAGMEQQFQQEAVKTANWMQYVNSLHLDGNEIALLKMLLILSPSLDDASASERALLTSQSESYAKILLSYVMARRGTQNGPRSFQEMLSLIETINHKVKQEKDLQVLALDMFTTMCPLIGEIIRM